MYSGIEDPIVPWHHGLEYYESVARKMGGYDEVQKFFAYYPMPGRAHTPDDWRGFGGRGVWTLDGPEKALHDWVKDGRFPGALQGRFADGVTTVPVQPYPLKTTGSAPSGWGVGRYGVRSDLVEMREKIEKEHTVKTVDKFYGFDRIVFDFDGHDAWVVCPKGESRPGKPWTWTMQWATAFVPRTNVPQMLNDGFHHVTIDTFRHRMDEEGLLVSAEFQKFLVEELGFAPKAYLIGMSWGGFFSTRYAVNCPQNVAKIYLDAPLLCFKDFNKDIGPWTGKMPEGGWAASPEMPLNMAERLAATKIPVLLLYGGVDAVVPPARNCEPFAERFKAAGGDITVVKRGLYAHHPHGVEVDETTIRDFFCGVGQSSCARPVSGPQLAARLAEGPTK